MSDLALARYTKVKRIENELQDRVGLVLSQKGNKVAIHWIGRKRKRGSSNINQLKVVGFATDAEIEAFEQAKRDRVTARNDKKTSNRKATQRRKS